MSRAPDPGVHRVNHQIRIPQIRVIGPDGEQLGIMTPDEAREIATERSLDLVEVAPTARPPVCRIMDYGKFRYQQSKKAAASKATQVELKTITLRPKTDTHDLETKLNQARGFLAKGDRVKFQMRLRGRESAHMDLCLEKMSAIIAALADAAQVAQSPSVEGRAISATVEPLLAHKPQGAATTQAAPRRPEGGAETAAPAQPGAPAERSSRRPQAPAPTITNRPRLTTGKPGQA